MKNNMYILAAAVLLIIGAGIISFFFMEQLENSLTGKATATAYIYQSPTENCTVYLSEGLNMVSFNCENQVGPLNRSLVDGNNQTLDFTAVFEYNPNNLADSWDSYNPALPNYTVQTIEHLDRRKAYWIHMNSSGTYVKEGLQFSSTAISLVTGWNFIGYPSGTIENISDVLAPIAGSYERVETYKNTTTGGNKIWLLHTPPSTGDLEYMIPMEGYWIYMNTSQTLVVNW